MMRPRQFLARCVRGLVDRAVRDERGGVNSMSIAMIAPALLVLVGLVVDGAGMAQAARYAEAEANNTARVAANAAAPGAAAGQFPARVAYQAGHQHLRQAGVSGTVRVEGQTVTVTTEHTYDTAFLSAIGIHTLVGTGSASVGLTVVNP